MAYLTAYRSWAEAPALSPCPALDCRCTATPEPKTYMPRNRSSSELGMTEVGVTPPLAAIVFFSCHSFFSSCSTHHKTVESVMQIAFFACPLPRSQKYSRISRWLQRRFGWSATIQLGHSPQTPVYVKPLSMSAVRICNLIICRIRPTASLVNFCRRQVHYAA